MIKFSSRAEKISWISIFALMFTAIICLSIGLAVVASKEEEDWDVVTEDYAYKADIVNDLDETPYSFLFEIKIANFTDRVQKFSYDLKVWDKFNPENSQNFTDLTTIVYPNEKERGGPAIFKMYDENGMEISDKKNSALNTFSISNFSMVDYYSSFVD